MLGSVLLAASLASAAPGNLLAGRAIQGSGLAGTPDVVTNGRLRPEGEPGSPEHSAILENPKSHLVIDLGTAREIRAMVFQFDADDKYMIAASVDGHNWERIVTVEAGLVGAGLRTRHAVFPQPPVARFLAVHAEGGDGRFFVAQLQAFAEVPAPWPPLLAVGDAGATVPPPRPPVAGATPGIPPSPGATERRMAHDQGLPPPPARPTRTRIAVLVGLISAAGILLLGWRLFFRERGHDS